MFVGRDLGLFVAWFLGVWVLVHDDQLQRLLGESDNRGSFGQPEFASLDAFDTTITAFAVETIKTLNMVGTSRSVHG